MAVEGSSGEPTLMAFRCDRVLDVHRAEWRTNALVLVEDEHIAQVGGECPSGVAVIELGDRSLLPGLIDSHTHVLVQGNRGPEEYAAQILQEAPAHRVARAIRAMATTLASGFTTVRDLGTEGAEFADVGLRDAANEGVVVGPRMFVAGPAISSTGSYPILGYRPDWEFPVGVAQCDGIEGCRLEVRRQLARGVDWVKVYVNGNRRVHETDDGYLDSPRIWTFEELQSLVDEVHAQGVRVAAHATSTTGADMAVATGVDSIEHGISIRPATARAMATKGITLVPTLLAIWRNSLERQGNKAAAQAVGVQRRSFQNCREAGVAMVFGTDAGAFDWLTVPQAEEFEILVELGLTPGEAIRSATYDAARFLGQGGDLGEITVGARADIIACRGDPLAAVSALLDVDMVVQGGRLIKHRGIAVVEDS
jgi:imidazolonepropionase-like amidohydrolase